MVKERFFSIDILRAVAIFAVIAIHVFSFNLTSPLNTWVWNYLHFIIVAFLFCSGFVLFAKYKDMDLHFRSVTTFYKKRLIRIVMPFYIYLVIHYTLTYLFPSFFSGLGLKFSWGYLLDSVILLDGVNLNWLPLLFVMMALLFPLLLYFYKKNSLLFGVYIAAGVASLFYFSVTVFPYQYYRYVMWLPWSLFFLLPWYYYQYRNTMFGIKKNLILSLCASIFFFVLFIIWQYLEKPMNLIDNKYPPNLFYVTYELAGTSMILALTNFPFWKNKFLSQIILFLSRFSYALFFVHYICIDIVLQTQKTIGFHLSVWAQLCIVVLMSTSLVYFYSRMPKSFAFSRKTLQTQQS